jgi:glycosyltransferase involved in cell wall biosynthesis
MVQTWREFEILVVDDGSTDNTQEVAAGYTSVRYLRQPNQGLPASRNTGLRHSTGSYLVFLDADDRLRPIALETGVNLLETHPECAFVSGRCQFMKADGSLLHCSPSLSNSSDHYAAMLRTNCIWNPACVVYRGAVFDSVSPFNSTLNAAEDYDLYLRIVRRYPIQYYPAVVVEYRLHSNNMSRDSALMLRSTVSVLRAQRKYLNGNQFYIEAYNIGIRFWQGRYGQPLVEEVLRHFRSRRWKQGVTGAIALLRYYTYGFWQCVYRGVRKTAMALSARNIW